jgi:hypothetical protein
MGLHAKLDVQPSTSKHGAMDALVPANLSSLFDRSLDSNTGFSSGSDEA